MVETLENLLQKLEALQKENEKLKSEAQAAALSERRFLDALRFSPMALCHHDRDLKYTWLYNAHMGFVQHDVIGKTDWDILDRDLADRMGVVKRRVLETGIGERVEMPTVADDENAEFFDLVVEPLRDDETGDIVGLSCSGIDVTDDRRRREAYKASEENLKFIFNASPQPIVVSHLERGHVLFCNMSARDLFGLSGETAKAGFLERLSLKAQVEACFTAGKTAMDLRFDFHHHDNGVRHLSLYATRVFYNGESAVLSTFVDWTEHAENQQKLEKEREKAELANIAKSQFLASASHDLRQPLHAMGLLLGILEQYINDESAMEIFNRISCSLEAMNDLFAGILDISKLDANVVPFEPKSSQIQDLFDILNRDFEPVAREKGLELTFVRTRKSVQTDPVQLERILRNLISNAIRYTEAGRILVGVRQKSQKIAIYVHDSGVGIAASDHARIFQEFQQIGNPERDRRKGLGLGLAICQRIASLLGTRIELSSEPGRGSSFWVELAMGDLPDPRGLVKDELQQDHLAGKRILLIEDEFDVRLATKFMLEAWGCEALAAASIAEVDHLFKAAQNPPDMIMADYRLRDSETGLEAIMRMRKLFNANIPAIVLSGDTMPGLLAELDHHGLTLLNKPLMPKDLKKCLVDILEG